MQFRQRSSLMLLVVAALSCLNFTVVHAATDAAPVFSIIETSATATTNGATADLTFIKHIRVHSSANDSIAAIAALALDLPGQVFISYAPTTAALPAGSKIVISGGALLGAISVYASSEALANSVGAASKRAMTDTKLALSSNATDTSTSDFILTEIVLLKKTALKKLLTHGAADVVVLDDVLFTKSKPDYPYMNAKTWTPPSPLETSTTSAAAATTSNATTGWTLERYKDEFASGRSQSNWILYPPPAAAAAATTSNNNIPLGVETVIAGTVNLYRTDVDLLPAGAIGILRMRGKATATAAIASANNSRSDVGVGDTYDTLRINFTTLDAYASLELVPHVVIQKPARATHTMQLREKQLIRTTDAVSSLIVLLNGTGNVIVAANESAVFVDNADFVSSGAGILYATFRELYGIYNVAIRFPNYDGVYANGTGMDPFPLNTFLLLPGKFCSPAPNALARLVFGDKVDPNAPCVVLPVPAKTGRASGTAAMTVPMKPLPKSASAASGTAMTVVAVALAIATFAMM